MKLRWHILLTILGCAILATLGGAAFLYSGVYDMAAIHPHSKLVRPLLLTLKRNSVVYHARDLQVPPLHDPELIQRGFVLYRAECVTCHGAPGEARSPVGRGLNPNPPPLEKAAEDWTPAEIAWIISNGLKMAGMPGFSLGQQTRDVWALTAFVLRINSLSPREYQRMLAASRGQLAPEEVRWTPPDAGWERLEALGVADEGRRLVHAFGCGTCHEIPGVPGARAHAGPPLTDWSKRHYLAGERVNVPANLVPWLLDPHAMEPGTAMPNVGLSEPQAVHIARYLYTLGREKPRRAEPWPGLNYAQTQPPTENQPARGDAAPSRLKRGSAPPTPDAGAAPSPALVPPADP